MSAPAKVKKARKHRPMSFGVYIRKLVHNHPKLESVSKNGGKVLNDISLDLTNKLSQEAANLTKAAKQKTVMARAVKDAARTIMSSHLAKEALHHAKSLADRYAKSGGDTGARNILVFPVGRLHTHMRSIVSNKMRVSPTASLYVAALLNYVISDILNGAAKVMQAMNREKKPTRLNERYIQMGLSNDSDLLQLIQGTISHGGVMPALHYALLPKKQREAVAAVQQEEERRVLAARNKGQKPARNLPVYRASLHYKPSSRRHRLGRPLMNVETVIPKPKKPSRFKRKPKQYS